MQARVSLVTLGVRDVARSRAFYCDALGFAASSASNEQVVFMRAGPVALALFGREALAEDARVDGQGSGFSGVTLAQNYPSKQAVDEAMQTARRAGAKISKEPADTFWGGYSGYFADPDGHVWEVAFNPFWPVDDEGRVTLPE